MKHMSSYFQVTALDDTYHLYGYFDTLTDALDALNESYHRALKLGYDNRHERWLIIRIDHLKLWGEDGAFKMEEIRKYTVERPKFSEEHECYVLTY